MVTTTWYRHRAAACIVASALTLPSACSGGGSPARSTAASQAGGGAGDTGESIRLDEQRTESIAFTGENFSFELDAAVIARSSEAFLANAAAFYPQVTASINAVTGLLDATVPIDYTDCGFENAFYTPVLRAITLCSEFDELQFQILLQTGLEPQQALVESDNVMGFVLNHEIGHALVDLLDLPVVGNGESAADGIATVLSVETSIQLDTIPYSLAGGLSLASQPTSYGGEHPGGEDRAGDIICWTSGGRPALLAEPRFAQLVAPFAAAGRDCVAEYQDRLSSVRRLLPGFGRDSALAGAAMSEATLQSVAALVANGGARVIVPAGKRGKSGEKMSMTR